MGRKTWHIGPVSLCNRNSIDKLERGIETSINEHSCLSWLDSKEPSSVLYISFGSMPRITPAQLVEIAYGLEASDHPFVWVIGRILRSSRESKQKDQRVEDLLPKGFEERIRESKRGLIIRGWAPQLLILEHQAVGGYMNHCGWNSIIEGVTAGLPMITWPFASEQFYNEKFVINVIKIGISIGSEEWVPLKAQPRVTVKRDKVRDAVDRLMGGGGGGEDVHDDQVVEMRKRAKEFAAKAKKAVEKGGSSAANIDAFIEEFKSREKIITVNQWKSRQDW